MVRTTLSHFQEVKVLNGPTSKRETEDSKELERPKKKTTNERHFFEIDLIIDFNEF
jgi:hypothetical protein